MAAVHKKLRRGKPAIWFSFFVAILWIIGPAGCSSATVQMIPTQASQTSAPRQLATSTHTRMVAVTLYITPTATLQPGETCTATQTRPPRPTRTPVPTPTPTPPALARSAALPFVRDGAALPENLAVIGPENLLQLTELARWGKGDIITLAYAPDESQVAVVTSQGVYFYDADTYELARFAPLQIWQPVAISSSLRYLAMEGERGSVEVWDILSGQQVFQVQVSENSIRAVAFTPDESRVYASDVLWGDTPIFKTYLLDNRTGQLIETLLYGMDKIVFSEDGKTWAILHDYQVVVWREDNPAVSQEITGTPYEDSPIAISRDGELLAVEGVSDDWNPRVDIWRLSDSSLWKTYQLHAPSETSGIQMPFTAHKVHAMPPRIPVQMSGPGKYQVTSLAFSPDGQVLAALNGFGMLHQWRLEDDALLRIVPIESRNVLYSPSGNDIAAWQYTAAFYQAQTGQLIYILGNHPGEVSDLRFAPDSRSLVIGSYDGKIWRRSTVKGEIIRTFKTQPNRPPSTYFTNAISDLDLARDGSLLTAGTHDGQIYLWSIEDGESRIFEAGSCGWPFYVSAVGISYDNQYLALQQAECAIEIIHLKDNHRQFLSPTHGYVEVSMALSPTAPWLITSAEKGVAIFNISDLTPVTRLGNIEVSYSPLRLSDDGQLIVMGSISEEAFEVWKLNDSNLVFSGKVNIESSDSFAFSPDNRLLAVTEGRKITLYDLSSGKELGRLYSGGSAIDFSPDGRLLVVGGEDGVVYIYGVPGQ